LQTQVREDLLDHRLFEDRRDDLQLATAVRAVRHVDLEHVLVQLGFNLVSPVGKSLAPGPRFSALAPRLRRRGWHVQWYTRAAELPRVAELHRDSGLTCVLDHLAGFGMHVAIDDPGWQAVEDLAAQGAWLKLSGWYRLDAQAPYTVLVPQIRRLAGLFSVRMVWGSDWPHTMFAADSLPSYGITWAPVIEALGRDGAEELQKRRPAIYG